MLNLWQFFFNSASWYSFFLKQKRVNVLKNDFFIIKSINIETIKILWTNIVLIHCWYMSLALDWVALIDIFGWVFDCSKDSLPQLLKVWEKEIHQNLALKYTKVFWLKSTMTFRVTILKFWKKTLNFFCNIQIWLNSDLKSVKSTISSNIKIYGISRNWESTFFVWKCLNNAV